MVLRLLLRTVALLAFSVAAAQAQPVEVRWADVALLDGRVLKASELTGRTVVVEFWASWCPFCARQNPLIEKLHREHGKRLVVLTFTIDKSEDEARAYMKKHGYTFAAAMATPQADRWFGVRRGLPELFVVDPGGRIVFRERGELFEEDVAALARFASN
jgi:thiol-disulfide isomerase/thioredoxin